MAVRTRLNPFNAELNPTCPLLALFGAHHILHVSRIRVNVIPYVACLVSKSTQLPISASFEILGVAVKILEDYIMFSFG